MDKEQRKRWKRSSLQTKQILAFTTIIVSFMAIMFFLHIRTLKTVREMTYDKMRAQAEYYLESFEMEVSHAINLQIEILCSEVAVDHLFKCMSRFPFPTENLPYGNRYTCFFINCKLYFPIRIIFFLPYSVLLSDTFLLPLCHSSKYWQSVAIPVFLSFHNPIA